MKKRRSCLSAVLFIVVVFMLLSRAQAWSAVLHVGAEWPGSPYATIQAAVDAAAAGDEIWVEHGTYTLTSTINVSKTVALYGGFNGSETSREQRNWATNVTTVDGNNSVCCFLVTSTVTIDGFTITKGYNAATGNGGGGIINGIDGGAAGDLTAANCIFTLNYSFKHDGAINNDNGNITVTNCSFSNNTAFNRGGAVGNNMGDNMTITNCTFSENSAGNAGAVYMRVDSVNNIITDCTFSKNRSTAANGDGGVIIGDQNVTITRCIFDNNTAGRDGIFATRGDKTAVFTNCIFSQNQVRNGGAIAVNGTGSLGTLKVMNCTIAANTISGTGGALYTTAPGGTGSVFTVTNSILWGNGGNAIDRSGTTQLLPTVSYTDIDNNTGYAGSNGNIKSDPLFVESGDYRLQASSPCIDAGTSAGAPPTDIAGTSRPQSAGYDMGSYEVMDTDKDGVPDEEDNCPTTPNGPLSGSCSASSDKPGINCTTNADCANGCSSNGLCINDQSDSDNDGVGDVCDCAPADVTKFKSWTVYLDADGDGHGAGAAVTVCGGATVPPGYSTTNDDGCPNDPLKTAPGFCGCGVPDTDSDGDGVLNCMDNCPDKPNGPNLGTCSSTSDKPGINCTSDADCANGCSSNGLCIKDQRDSDSDGKGDVCDF